MKNGSKLLIDEISLASDSVLERLNPLLESSRTVLLTDAGADAEVVVAHSDFQVVATMNPGTDHGKKELSKALRNRFTEIWCSCDHPVEDVKKIIAGRMSILGYNVDAELGHVIDGIVEFFITFTEKFGNTFRIVFSIRDIIAAADLFLACKNVAEFSTHDAFINSLTGVVVDSIGVLPARTTYNAAKLKKKCHKMILSIAQKHQLLPVVEQEIAEKQNSLFFGNFPIELGKLPTETVKQYSFSTPTTEQNALRVARALLLEKPIMLEGSPGAGKSSLIVALAKVTGHSLVRLNLSDQTDLSDLFGHDVPISKPDGTISFQWQDGPILKAIKEGSWILLDEMNLASQSVLEGLNSCFDFRQELFIAELNKKFIINSDQCRFFACQNPQTQGGNRRALPKSFLNRFTSIYIEPFIAQDFSLILNQELPDSRLIVEKMIRFNREMQTLVKKECPGIEFEFNMRDLLRWAQFIHEFHDISVGAEILYINRLPYAPIQQDAKQCFGKIFGTDLLTQNSTIFYDDTAGICFGQKKYNISVQNMPSLPLSNLLLLSSQSTLLQQLCICIKLNWIVLLNGPRLNGKSSVIETLCLLSQSKLKRMRLNKETDASELLGSYEQVKNYCNFLNLIL
uniref:Midasin n=1 Tax=Panagrolaimus superbus TaxID=310955 RepID=A0A914Z5M4_9BILA